MMSLASLTGILLRFVLSFSAPLSADAVDVTLLLPTLPVEEEWEWGEEPEVYGPDTLYEYLNGGAPQYISYGFVKLAHARYVYQGDDLKSVTVDVFDMGSQLGAFGIYRSVRPQKFNPRSWGTEGYRSGVIGAAWKGRVYVHAAADDETEELVRKLETVICDVISGFSGEVGWPDELTLLPRNGLLPDRTRFIGKALLGHSFLPGGFLAEYDLGASESTLFLSKLSSPEEAAHVFNLLRSFELDRGEVIGSCEIGESCFGVKDPGLGRGIVLCRGNFVGGMWRIQQYPAVLAALQELDRNLVLREGAQELATDPEQNP